MTVCTFTYIVYITSTQLVLSKLVRKKKYLEICSRIDSCLSYSGELGALLYCRSKLSMFLNLFKYNIWINNKYVCCGVKTWRDCGYYFKRSSIIIIIYVEPLVNVDNFVCVYHTLKILLSIFQVWNKTIFLIVIFKNSVGYRILIFFVNVLSYLHGVYCSHWYCLQFAHDV